MNNAQPASTFFISVDGESTKGPYVMEQIKTMWDNGLLTVNSLFWNEESSEWRPLLELLSRQPPKEPPPPPPPVPLGRAVPESKRQRQAKTAPARAPLPHPSEVHLAGVDTAARPWSRLMARYIDMQIYGILCVPLFKLAFHAPSFPSSNWIWGTFYVIGAASEAVCLAAFGRTFGKWLFGLRLTDLEGQKIAGGIGVRRFNSVLWRCVPFALPFCGVLAYRDLKRTGSTAWDKRYQCRVVHESESAIRIVVALALLCFFVRSTVIFWAGLLADENPRPASAMNAPSAPQSSVTPRPHESSKPSYLWLNPTDLHDSRLEPEAKPAAESIAAAKEPSHPRQREIVPNSTARATPAPVAAVETPKPVPSLAELTKECQKYLVIVEGNASLGSASIINFNGRDGKMPIMVTNAHVLSGNGIVKFRLLNGKELTPDSLSVPYDHRDILVAKQGQVAGGLEASASVDSDVSIGDEVVVLGNSQGSGVVTQIFGKVLGIGPDLIETDAAFVHGNSGSPIIHVKTGKVIGIATFAITRQLDNLSRNTRFKETRRFGYRIDTISRWFDVAGPTFLEEGLVVAAARQRNDDLVMLAQEIMTRKLVTPAKYDPKSWVGSYVRLLGQYTVQQDADGFWATELDFRQKFYNDIADVQGNNFSPYHRQALEEEAKTREILFQYFSNSDWDVQFSSEGL